MSKYNIGTLNNISQAGMSRFTDDYLIVDAEHISEANGIIVRSFKMHDMDFSDNLLAIARAGAGVNNIPLERCSENGIAVFNAPGANANAVKELCLAALIGGARNIYEGVSWANGLEGDVAAEVEAGKKQFAGTEIAGKTIGIIGLGNIGARLANACDALGLKVVGNSLVIDPCLSAPCEMYDDINEMVKECDFISIHVPSLPETKEMICADLIEEMKDGVIILNYARPDLVNDDDIIKACESGKVRKYMTDVPDEKLIGRKNIICTPHLGASTAEAEENCAAMAADELMDYLSYGNIHNSVNLPDVQIDKSVEGKRVGIIYKSQMAAGSNSVVAQSAAIENIIKAAAGSDKIRALKVGAARGAFGYALAVLTDGAAADALLKIDDDSIVLIRLI